MINLEMIRALPDTELHELIALHCAGLLPIARAHVRAATGCTHIAPDGGFYTVPEYTASWDLTMPLANQARITRSWTMVIAEDADGSFSRLARDRWEWEYHCYAQPRHESRTARVASGADDYAHCRALCELALWRVMQDQDAEENLDVP